MIEADTPTLWEIRSHTDHATAIAVIVIALTHTARLVNVENNLNEIQIGEIANDVLNDYGYLKVEEVKHLLKTAVKTQKIFGRLDYNVIMNWFADYDADRTSHCADISDRDADRLHNHPLPPDPAAVTYRVYINRLWDRALYADPEAVERLSDIISNPVLNRLGFAAAHAEGTPLPKNHTPKPFQSCQPDNPTL